MNFPPFGGHFPGSISTMQQFAAKFGHETPTNGIYPAQNCVPNRYLPTNQITQQSTINNQHQQLHKYQQNSSTQQYSSVNQGIYTIDKRQNYGDNDLQQLCNSLLQNGQNNEHKNQQPQVNQVAEKIKEESHLQNHQLHPQSNQNFPSWQSSITGTSVADYLTHLPTTTLPLSIHHFLKYSAENIKKEQGNLNIPNHLENSLELKSELLNIPPVMNNQQPNNVVKKKKKKRSNKEKKPRPKPGEIRLTTALDGSTLYCCPECHMAYPEKELLEQHLVGHTMERKFVCDICGAGLKRKDHLTRHKQSHNPERPFVCTVCMKAFKRKEQLTLHYVIHSGEKRHICNECGKGFYRKDHLRKHTRSHITRRVKAELSQQGNNQQALHSMIAGTSNSQVLLS